MDPINYNLNPTNPMQAFNEALNFGGTIMQSRARTAEAQAKIAAQEAEAARQAQIDGYLAKITQPGATAQDYLNLAVMLPEDQSKAILETFKLKTEAEQKADLDDTSQVFSALKVGRADLAADLLRKQAEAERAAGNEQGAKFGETLAQMVEVGPDGAKNVETMLGYSLATMSKDAMDSILKFQESPFALQVKEAEGKYADARQAADIRKLDAETMKFLADAEMQKLKNNQPPGVEIDESARKIMNGATEASLASDLLASQSDNLATSFEKLRPAAGWSGNVYEQLKKIAGGQDKLTSLKQEYVKLRNTDVLKNLPPGVASDKDIEIALKAFPDENANPDQIASFLRGMSKLQRYNSAINRSKAEWVNQNGSLGPARSDFKAGDQAVKRGMAFWDFTKGIAVPNVSGYEVPKAAPAGAAATPAVEVPVEVDY